MLFNRFALDFSYKQPEKHERQKQKICVSCFLMVQVFKIAKIPCFNAAGTFSGKVKRRCVTQSFFLLHSCLSFQFPVSVLLSFALSILFVMLKIHILYLKMQTQDHFWSRAHSEVASLSFLCLRKKHILYLLKLNCDFSSKVKIFTQSTH